MNPTPTPTPALQAGPGLAQALGTMLHAGMPTTGGGEPPDDEQLVDHDEFRQVAHDLANGRDALLVMCSLLRGADAVVPDPRLCNGLAVLLEGALGRLGVALDGLAVLAEGLQIDGVHGLA